MRKGGEEDSRGQTTSYTGSCGVRSKKRYAEIEKGKGPEAEDSWDNLRKAGQKKAKLRPGIHK